MKPRCFFQILLLAAIACWLPNFARAETSSENARIEALIQHVETLKDAKFIRNGTEYDAKSAAKFLRGKWHSKEKEIKTADEFIGKVASISSTTGKPYLIRFGDGREVTCGAYLKEQLKK